MTNGAGKVPNKGRIAYIDVFKGILITLVVWGHIVYVVQLSTGVRLSSTVWRFVSEISDNWIAPYYMGAFFCITGFCSGFKKSFKEQIKNDFKRLIIPAIFIPFVMFFFRENPVDVLREHCNNLLYGKVAWFLVAMFIARGLHKLIIERYENRVFRVIILIMMSIGGCWLINKIPEYNFFWLFHALSFTIFVNIGFSLKQYKITFKHGLLFLIVYVLTEVLLKINNIRSPALCEIIMFRTYLWPIYIVLTLSGSCVLLLISKKIGKSTVLQYIGRNSLVIYLTHITFIRLCAHTINEYIGTHGNETVPGIMILLLMLLGGLLWGGLWAYVLSRRYTKWIIGEF